MDLYRESLSGARLKACYDLASGPVRRYLAAEIDHVLSRIGPDDRILDLGCGYGRTASEFARKARLVVGIDTSMASLSFGWPGLRNLENVALLQMDASRLGFGGKGGARANWLSTHLVCKSRISLEPD